MRQADELSVRSQGCARLPKDVIAQNALEDVLGDGDDFAGTDLRQGRSPRVRATDRWRTQVSPHLQPRGDAELGGPHVSLDAALAQDLDRTRVDAPGAR